jgi:phage portal protein BeeE
LGNGLKFQSMSLSSQDSQIIEAFGMTVESISRVFRVPLQLINSMTGATFNNAEATMRWFLASGMGFLLENIELELSKLFGLPFNERLNFDTVALLRSDWKTQIETLGEGVLKGIYSPDEARAKVGLGPVPNGAGAEPRVQQQVVPLSAWEQTLSTPAPAPQSQPEDDTEDDTEDDAEMSLYAGIMKGKTYGN